MEAEWTDIRKYGLILVIAVLYTIFVVTLIDAALTAPEYRDYCGGEEYHRPAPPHGDTCPTLNISQEERQSCHEDGGTIIYEYGENGCPTGYTCSMCQSQYEDARKTHNLHIFLISAVLGILSIISGMMLPREENRLNEWIGSGLILGGVLTIFTGTVQSFGSIGKLYRPVIILGELILVIYLAYRFYGENTG